ncbi:IclR family transcriptional regulator [Rhizomonospora bruguierae]|uniref:IclR family transcriptional regulator n=1 Tax=Rhizomonospora bruguierae TaxID=1581705 RepID=UPI001BCFF165|nr:IclR family transcriptional regulator [Micromonospora sp. NBRC 107566]
MTESAGRDAQHNGLQRALSVIYALAATDDLELGVTDLARRLSLPKTVVHRLLRGLVEARFAKYNENTRRYSLGPGAFTVGLAALRKIDIQGFVRSELERISALSNETSTFSALQGRGRVYVDQVVPDRSTAFEVRIGVPYPLHAGASSKSILAAHTTEESEALLAMPLARLTPRTATDIARLKVELRHIRRRGFAVSFGERDRDGAGVAAAVRQPGGGVFGAVSICFPISRYDPARAREFGEIVKGAARIIGQELAEQSDRARTIRPVAHEGDSAPG